MQHVIGSAGADYGRRLQSLLGFFVAARVLRNEPMIAIADGEDIVAVAIMTPPGSRETPAELGERREAVWRELGPAARARYETLGTVWQKFGVAQPNLHLNMIGVRRSHSGRGMGRQLLEAVHRLSESDSRSAGVTLTTEDPGNVPWYSSFGYDFVGHIRVSDTLETWGFFRPNDTTS